MNVWQVRLYHTRKRKVEHVTVRCMCIGEVLEHVRRSPKVTKYHDIIKIECVSKWITQQIPPTR